MLVLEWKETAFIEKVNPGFFCWFPTTIVVHQSGAPIWRLQTKLYKVAWNILANTSYSETVGHKDLRLGQIFYTYALVFYNISFSWLLKKKHSFLFPFSLLKNWGDCLFCGGGGGGGGGRMWNAFYIFKFYQKTLLNFLFIFYKKF